MNIHTPNRNPHNSLYKEDNFHGIPALKRYDSTTRFSPSIEGENSDLRGLKLEEKIISLQLSDCPQSMTELNSKPLIVEGKGPFLYKRSKSKVITVKTQKINVNTSAWKPRDNEDTITLQRLPSIYQNDSPILQLGQEIEYPTGRPVLLHKDSVISNLCNNSTEEVENLMNSPFSSGLKQGQASERWIVDAVACDETDRPFKRQYSQVRPRKINDGITRFEETDEYKRTHADTEVEDSQTRREKTKRLFRIREVEQAGDHESNSNNQESRERSARRNRQGNLENQHPSRENVASININQSPGPEAQGSGQAANANQQENVNQTGSNQQFGAVDPQRQAQARLEASLYIKRCFTFFLAIGLASLFLLLMIGNDFSHRSIFVVSYSYLVYFGIENMIRTFCMKREHWKKIEDLFNMCDAFSGLALLIMIDLRLSDVLAVSMIGSLPFLASLITYLPVSKAPTSTKVRRIFIGAFYTLQSFFVTAKLDKVLDWDWRIIFLFGWVCLGIIGLYLVAYGLIFFLAILFGIFRQRLFENIGILTQFIGIFWYVLYFGQGIIAFMALMGVAQAYGDMQNFNLLKLAAAIGAYTNCFLLLYTLVVYKPLMKFMEIFNETDSSRANVIDGPGADNQPKIVNIQVEKKESYFVMLSSTYFLPLDKNFVAKNKEKLNKIKGMVLSLRLWKPRVHNEESMHVGVPVEPINIQVLKKYKEVLDERFNKIASQTRLENELIKTPRSLRPRISALKLETVQEDHKIKDIRHDLEVMKTNRRLNLSADDIDFKENSISPKNEEHANGEKLCYLCYDAPPNAVLLKCGHGGICYNCASALVKKKNECMECRRPVEAIYKVDPNPRMKDIIKGVELCKVELG